MVCRDSDERHIRALLLQAVAGEPLTLRRVRHEEVSDTDKARITIEFGWRRTQSRRDGANRVGGQATVGAWPRMDVSRSCALAHPWW